MGLGLRAAPSVTIQSQDPGAGCEAQGSDSVLLVVVRV